MYIKKTWVCGNVIEVKKTYSARFGRRIPRGTNEKETPEKMEKVNLRNAIAELRRVLNANFKPGDWHLQFTYPQKMPPTREQAKEDREKLIRRLRELYGDSGLELKAVKVTEWEGKRIHHHIVMNAEKGKLNKVKKEWRKIIKEKYYTEEERKKGEPLHLIIRLSILDDSGQYGKLASYLLKETKKSAGKGCRRWTGTRNLIRPKPEIEIIGAKSFRKDFPERKGFYVDKEESYSGVSELTGIPVQEIIYVRLRGIRDEN